MSSIIFVPVDKALHFVYGLFTYVGEKAQTVIKELVCVSAVRQRNFVSSSRCVI
jgi:hypothetical protein